MPWAAGLMLSLLYCYTWFATKLSWLAMNMNSLTKANQIVSLVSKGFKGGFSGLRMEVQLTSRASSCVKCCGHCHYFLNSLATSKSLFVLICQKKCNLWLQNYCLMNCFIQLHNWWKFHITLNILGLSLDVFASSQSPWRQRQKKAFCTDWSLFLMNIQRLASITKNRKTYQSNHLYWYRATDLSVLSNDSPPVDRNLRTISLF